jgi:hypothetical protein
VIFVKKSLHECHLNDLHTTTCSGMLGHHMKEWRMFVRSTVPRKVSQAMNEKLTTSFTSDEELPLF